MSAQLSRTLVAMSQLPFAFPVFHKGLHDAATLERAAQALDVGACHRLDEDALRRGHHVRARAFLDLKLPAEPARNDHLALDGEVNRICLCCRIHAWSIRS